MNTTNAIILSAVIVAVGTVAQGGKGTFSDPKFIVGAAASALFLAVLSDIPTTHDIAQGFAYLALTAATLGYGPSILGAASGKGSPSVATGAAQSAQRNN